MNFRLVTKSIHAMLDYPVVFLAVPFALGFSGMDQWYYLANGAAVMTVVSLHQKEANAKPANGQRVQAAV